MIRTLVTLEKKLWWQKTESTQCKSTFGQAAQKVWEWHNIKSIFGLAQNILRPLEGRGISFLFYTCVKHFLSCCA